MKYTYLLALASVAAAASTGFSQTTSIPITNSTFNTPSTASGSYSAIAGAAGSGTLTGWTVSDGGNAIVSVQHPVTPPTAVAGQDNTQNIEEFYWAGNGWTGAVNVSQVTTASFVTGDSYSLTADATVFSGATALTGASIFIANSSGTVLASTSLTGFTAGAYTQFTVPFTSTGLLGDTGAIEVGYAAPNTQSSSGQIFMEIDNFALTQTAPPITPEPSSIAIAALGGFGLLGLVRRRRA